MKKQTIVYITSIVILIAIIIVGGLRLNTYKTELSNLRGELENLKTEFTELQEENKELKIENEALKKQTEDLKEEYDKLLDKIVEQSKMRANQESDALLQDNLEQYNLVELFNNPDSIKIDDEGNITFSTEFTDMLKSMTLFSNCTTDDIIYCFNTSEVARDILQEAIDYDRTAESFIELFKREDILEYFTRGNEAGDETLRVLFRAPVEETTQPPLEHYPNQEIPPQQQQPQPEQPPQQPPVQQEPDPGNGAQNGDGTDNVTQGNDSERPPVVVVGGTLYHNQAQDTDHVLESDIGVH